MWGMVHFLNSFGRAGWGHCLVLEMSASDPKDAPPGFGRHWYMVFKIPDEQLATICIRFLGSVACLLFIMQLYKAWDVLRRKRKSVIADSFDEFVVKGELNSISSDFVFPNILFNILKRACVSFNKL